MAEQPPILDYLPKPKVGPDRLGKIAVCLAVGSATLFVAWLVFIYPATRPPYDVAYMVRSRWKIVTLAGGALGLAFASIALGGTTLLLRNRVSLPSVVAVVVAGATVITMLILT